MAIHELDAGGGYVMDRSNTAKGACPAISTRLQSPGFTSPT